MRTPTTVIVSILNEKKNVKCFQNSFTHLTATFTDDSSSETDMMTGNIDAYIIRSYIF